MNLEEWQALFPLSYVSSFVLAGLKKFGMYARNCLLTILQAVHKKSPG